MSILSLAALSLVMLAVSTSWACVVASSCVMALFWQQCGWLAHDFLHHQVFVDRRLNDCAGLFWGNLAQGFSVAWWKDKHNAHHASPNELKPGDPVSVDPDIDTLPLLAWSADQLEALGAGSRSLVRVQHWLLFPILLFARLSWCVQSLAFPLRGKARMGRAAAEVAALGAHYGWLLGATWALLPPVKALAFLVLSELLCGVLLSFVFIQSHNGMEVYSDARDFVSAQLASTRNVHASAFNDWFTGGLNRQIEARPLRVKGCARGLAAGWLLTLPHRSTTCSLRCPDTTWPRPSRWCASSAPDMAFTTRRPPFWWLRGG